MDEAAARMLAPAGQPSQPPLLDETTWMTQ
jgi:hypothetical protein